MALFTLTRQRWSERLRLWWDEYYTDNPVVWALQRDAVRHMRERTNDMRLRVLPLWSRARTLWMLLWWTLTLIAGIALMFYPSQVPDLKLQLAQLLNRPAIIVILIGISQMGSVAYSGSLIFFLQEMRNSRQRAALGLTRLSGAHLVNGILLNAVARDALPRAVMGYLPLLWLLHATPSGAWLWGLWTAFGGIATWTGALAFFHLLLALTASAEPAVQEADAGRQTDIGTTRKVVQAISLFTLVPIVGVILWGGKAVWIAAPVLGGLCALAYRPALRRAERALRSKEPTIVPSEGRWQ